MSATTYHLFLSLENESNATEAESERDEEYQLLAIYAQLVNNGIPLGGFFMFDEQ